MIIEPSPEIAIRIVKSVDLENALPRRSSMQVIATQAAMLRIEPIHEQVAFMCHSMVYRLIAMRQNWLKDMQ